MTTEPDVSPTNKVNSHHVSLQDQAGTKYGLILSPNGNAIERRPKANSQHVPFTQNDWSGGRGLKVATDDRSRFADSKRLNTRKPGLVTLGGQETYTQGHRQSEQHMPHASDGVTWQSFNTNNRYIAASFQATASGVRAYVYLWIRRRGAPTSSLKVELCENNATPSNHPGSVIHQEAIITTADITDTVSVLYEFLLPIGADVVSATLYWVKVYTSAADSATDYWQVGVDANAGSTTLASPDNSAWSTAAYSLYYRVVDNSQMQGAMFFVYKSQLYMLTRESETTAPRLFVNGYRGVVTSTSLSLYDSTQAWTTNALAGTLALVIEGPNSEWSQPYRTIASNEAGVAHFTGRRGAFGKKFETGKSVYVILGTDVWTEITGHGLTVLPTSILVTGDMVYFAQGDSIKMRRMREYNNNGTWTRSFAQEDNYAKHLLSFQHKTKGLTICKVNDFDNAGRPSFAQATAEPWGRRLKFPWLVNDCEVTTGWTAGAGAAITVDTADFMTGSASLKLTVSSGPANPVAYFSVGNEFARQTNANVLAGQRQLRFWFKSANATAEGDVKAFLSISGTAASSIQDLPLPALVPGEWFQITLPYIDTAAGLNTVLALGLRVTAATGTYWIDGIESIPNGSEVPLGKPGDKVTGLELYGDPEVPWVFRAGSLGYVDNGTYTPVPLREYSQVENIHNGAGHLVHDVYLYFSFLQGLEEYYRANLDDVGPNKDEGMPLERQGYVTSMVGYPDRFLYNYDGGTTGYSSILTRKGGGHHEDYRCDAAGKRIRAIFLQVIPGDMADRLWFSEGEDIAYLPMPGNTVNELTDSTYRFTHEGVLELAWIGDDQQRIFSYVKLGLENVSAARCIEWDYKLDEETAWTPSATPFASGPVQTILLNKTGKRLKVRFRVQSNDNTETPRITSINISTTAQPDTRYAYSMTFVYSDNGRDLLGNAEKYTRAETLIAQLDTWMTSKTPLTMRSISETFDNKTITLDPTPLRPVANETQEQQEKMSGTLTAVEPQ
jgi:hypothetical protein